MKPAHHKFEITSTNSSRMTTQAPDPRTFKSWEEAFHFPIPIIRKFEGQLRGNGNDNKEKLRSLVG